MKTKSILLIVLVFFAMYGYTQSNDEYARLQKQIAAEEQELKKLKAEKASATKQLSAIKRKQDTYQNLLAKLNVDINASDVRVREIRTEVKETERAIKQIKDEAIKSNTFIIDNLGYSNVKIIASASPQGDAIKAVELLSVALELMADKTNELKRYTERLNILKDEETAKLDELKVLKAERVKAINELKAETKEYNNMLAMLKHDEQGRREYIEMLEFRRNELNSEIDEVAGMVTTSDGSFAKNKGKYPWAITGRVIENYGEHLVKEANIKVFNKGIKIRPSATAPAKAIASGTVLYANYMRGFGYVVVLTHGTPYYTIYANMSSLYVKEGDVVAQLDTVGYVSVGEGYSDPYLYFEVRQNENALNPRHWLVKR